MNDALVIIPTYNEKENVREIMAAVLSAARRADLLFVDDDSPDGTGHIIDELVAEQARVHVLHRSGKQGLGRAYLAGFTWALERHYQFILEMDADFSHNPTDVPRLIQTAEVNDLALGSRFVDGIRVINWPLERLILSKAAALYVRVITGLPVMDPTGGFKCFRREVLETVDLTRIRSNGYSFQIEMNHRAWMLGFKVTEVPIVFEERRVGVSKMNAAIVREALWMVWKILFRARLRRRPQGVHPRSVHAREATT
jgi:dolichol-phosphate mannosyltransferase